MAKSIGGVVCMSDANIMAEFAEEVSNKASEHISDGQKKNKASEQLFFRFLSHNSRKSLNPWKSKMVRAVGPLQEELDEEKLQLIRKLANDFFQAWLKAHRKEFRRQTTPVIINFAQLKATWERIILQIDRSNKTIQAHSLDQAAEILRDRVQKLRTSTPEKREVANFMIDQWNHVLNPWRQKHAGKETLKTSLGREGTERMWKYARQFADEWVAYHEIAFQKQHTTSQAGSSVASSSASVPAQANLDRKNTNDKTPMDECRYERRCRC
jgi:hypothetical protein